jgi:hypothetical protein
VGETGGARTPRSTTALVVVGTLALIAFHLWTSRHAPGPTVAPDEAGYLGNARWLAGDSGRFTMGIAPQCELALVVT